VVVTDARFRALQSQRPAASNPHASTRSLSTLTSPSWRKATSRSYPARHRRYVGLQSAIARAPNLPRHGSTAHAGQECLVIEYAPPTPTSHPKLYVPSLKPTSSANTLAPAKPAPAQHPRRHALAAPRPRPPRRPRRRRTSSPSGRRESQPGHAFAPTPLQREFESASSTRKPRPAARHPRNQGEWNAQTHDRLIAATSASARPKSASAPLQSRPGRQTGRRARPHHRPRQQHFNTSASAWPITHPHRAALPLPHRRAQEQVIRDLAAGAVDIVIGTTASSRTTSHQRPRPRRH